MIRILIITFHPVPYRNHIFDFFKNDSDILLKVLYWEKPDIDRGIDINIVLQHFAVYLSKSYFKLTREIFQFNPTLVIISGLGSVFAIYSILLCMLRKYKYAIHSESHDLKNRRFIIKKIRDKLYRFLLKKVCLIFPTSTLAEIYLRKYLLKDAPSCLFPNSASYSEIVNRVKAFRNELQFSNWNPPFNVLYVGRLVKEKNIAVLLNAWKICENENSDLNLILVGDGNQRFFLEQLSKNLSLKNVEFVGRKKYEDIFEYYAKAHLFVLPSYEEPYGAVINEALSAGLPIIISNRVGCSLDTLKEGLNGFSFHFSNPSELASKILLVFQDQVLWRQMSNCSIKIAKNFETANIALNIKRTVLSVLNSD